MKKPADQKPDFCSMFGVFNLREGIELPEFKLAYNAFCIHLSQRGYVHSSRVWRRAYHSGYDANFLEFSIIVEMCFHNYAASLECWRYVEANEEPIRTLHVAMNKKVMEARFVLCREGT
jgi:hypothetical protein